MKTGGKNRAIPVVGLTGGIAAGKSAVARFFAEAGVPVLDADVISRELSASGGAAHATISKEFGTTDPSALREQVFQDPSARTKLESILHPLIIAESERRFEQLGQASPPPAFVVYEAALLVETGRYREFDALVVVDATPEVRRERLAKRNKDAARLAEKILRAQAGDAARLKVATHVVKNSGSLDELRSQVQNLIEVFRKQFASPK
ncbi:MAG: dephospho-CoA kinase [Bacteriovoracia bacterium]